MAVRIPYTTVKADHHDEQLAGIAQDTGFLLPELIGLRATHRDGIRVGLRYTVETSDLRDPAELHVRDHMIRQIAAWDDPADHGRLAGLSGVTEVELERILAEG